MLAFARVQLNMGREEFMQITPRYFQALCKQVEHLDRPRNTTLEIMVGQLLAMVGNIGYSGLEKPMRAQDFMPSEWAKKAAAANAKAVRKPRMTKKRQIALAAQFRETFMHFVAK